MSDPTSDLEAWAASYRAARSPGPARRRAIAASVRAGIEAEDRRIRRQRWVGIGVLVAAGVLGVLALGRLLDSAGTQVGKADDPSLAPHSVAGEPVHEAHGGKLAPQDRAAAPSEPAPISGLEAPVTVSGGAEPSPEPEPRTTPTRRRSGSEPTDTPVVDAPTTVEPPDELESMRLLRDAERKLETDTAESLRLLERHAERFPSSTLSLEREALTVIALCRLGRADAGRERQQAFLRRSGSNAYAKRVKSACEAPPAR